MLRRCVRRGVRQLLAVTTLAIERLMLRAGIDPQRMGPPSMSGGQPVLALAIWVNERSINSLSVFEECGLQADPMHRPRWRYPNRRRSNKPHGGKR
jgi:N-acyl-L-homoserine lactone synthetase